MDDVLWTEEFAYHFFEFVPYKQPELHVRDVFSLIYVYRGSGTMRLGDEHLPFAKRDVVLVSPCVPYMFEFDPSSADAEGRVCLVTVFISPAFLKNIAESFGELRACMERILSLRGGFVFDAPMARRIIALLNTMRRSDLHKIGAVFDLLLLVGELSHERAVGYDHRMSGDKFLGCLRAFLDARRTEGIRKEDLARHLGMSCASFDIYLRRYSGMSFTQFLNDYRLRHAIRLLADGEMPVAEVCFLSGFNSISHFNHLFKVYTGESPTKFRRTCPVRED